ncbi:glycosyltransferase family 2 protein [Arthrobacter sp. KBS0703]|uniref:glycosyltransferase family 2 protein n=1 Tax=Arthrobacter sp. KBS0703 TaxID=1955698 RepID=UPI001115AFF7|nr:glycosyltransferase family 2 protein [Arthrobacter sp. KBS0703]TSE14725.1 glycosyltransferase family 2 protein [Arthrobacter sp. KBS0703]
MSDACTYDVVFLALARDCASTIPGVLHGLDELRKNGLRACLIVGENGSRDNSRELLENAVTSTGMVQLVDTSFMSDAEGRLERMAIGRQFLADQAKELPGSVRTICVLDMDEPFLERLDIALFRASLSRLDSDDTIFALAATSRPSYYDLLAFEDETRSFAGLDKRIERLQSNPVAYYRLFRDFIYPEQQRLTTASDIACLSAFNGMCLYKADLYGQGSYVPSVSGPWVCEHVTFNRSMASATGRWMVIHGALVLPQPPEHGRRTLPGFAWQRVRKLPRLLSAKLQRSWTAKNQTLKSRY